MDKKLRNIIIYITVAVMVVLGVAFLMTQNSSASYTTSQLVNLFRDHQVESYIINYGTDADNGRIVYGNSKAGIY